MLRLRLLTWNIGFASRKKQFIQSDSERASKIYKFIDEIKPDAIALQEMASRNYFDGIQFNFEQFVKSIDQQLDCIHFEPTTILNSRNSYPFGKIKELNQKFGIVWLAFGPGIWIRNTHDWHLRNLYSENTQYPAIVEIQRPLPHGLYMGSKSAPTSLEAQKEFSAGRDEEDRPVLWARIANQDGRPVNKKLYFLSLHLPILNNEEMQKSRGIFTKSQKSIAENVLNWSADLIKNRTVDELGSALRYHFLRQVISQIKRIEDFWSTVDKGIECIFILAGDFNFYHTTATLNLKTPEQIYLEENGFCYVKTDGYTRPSNSIERLIDNIWIRNHKQMQELRINMNDNDFPIEKSDYINLFDQLSDHYPVIADMFFDEK